MMLAAGVRKQTFLLLATMLLIVTLSATACDNASFALADFTPNDLTPQMTLKTFCAAFKAGDYQTTYNQFASTSPFRRMPEPTYASDLQANLASRGGVTDCAVSQVRQSGSSASGVVTFTFETGQEIDSYTLVNENGRWKIVFVAPWVPNGD
jgi:hypothetical protein